MQRCKAKSKRSGQQCKNYAVKGTAVCRMHGSGGGPKTVIGWIKCKNAPLKHGFYSKEEVEERTLVLGHRHESTSKRSKSTVYDHSKL